MTHDANRSARGRRLAGLLLATLATLALWCTPASADYIYPYVSSFGSFSSGAGVQGIAVDSSSGYVYVYDSAQEKIFKFDASGNPVNFSATGTNAISGVKFSYSSESGRGELAVDNSSGPAKGDIYVARDLGSLSSETEGIGIYSAAGAKLGELTREPPNPWSADACGVAVDAAGSVYVGLAGYGGVVNKYTPTANPVTNANYVASLGAIEPQPCNVAVDSAGNVFVAVAEYSARGERGVVTRFEASQVGTYSGLKTGSQVDPHGVTLAVDPATDRVFVDEGNQVSVFGPHGEPFDEPLLTLAGSGPGAISHAGGIAVSGFNHDLYVSNGAGGVNIFAALLVPDVTTGAATGNAPTSVTLHGSVNPDGVGVSDCRFEYGTTSAYGQSEACAVTVGSGTSTVAVHADLSGLSPGTVYHYRLLAANANGSSHGSDQSFESAGVPGVSHTRVERTSDSEATLSAAIDPRYFSTSYHVEYGPTSAYGQSTPESEPLGSDGFVNHLATAGLSGLAPSSTYHFRFVATNSYGVGYGPDWTLSTCAGPRGGPSAALPDCRAYEQVSPVDKEGNDAGRGPWGDTTDPAWSAPSGDVAAFESVSGFAGTLAYTAQNAYRSVRTASAWETLPLDPPTGPVVTTAPGSNNLSAVLGASPDFARQLVVSDAKLTSDAVEGLGNIYLHDSSGNSYTLVTTASAKTGAFAATATFVGAAPDGSRFVFETAQALASTPAPPSGASLNLYEWAGGELRLVGVLPDGSVAPSGAESARPALSKSANAVSTAYQAVSADGKRIYWTLPGGGPVYLRENGQTKLVSARQSDGSAQPARFWYATPDGSQAYLTSAARLTADASPSGEDLYRYDVASGSLTDLTPSAGGAGVEGLLGLGSGADGSFVYYLARGALAAGAGAGQENLYVLHDGATRFIGSLSSTRLRGTITDYGITGGDEISWRTSTDGRYLGFVIDGSIAGPHPQPNQVKQQAYLYDYGADSLDCASCPPGGGTASSAARLPVSQNFQPFTGMRAGARRFVSDNGQMFFDTVGALLAADTNGKRDVYEYEHGNLYLISTGQSNAESDLADVSESGNDVFFMTREGLVGQDKDENVDLYDARVGGGLPAQNATPPPPVCEAGEACRGPGTEEGPSSTAGTAVFEAPPNPVYCHKGFVKRHGHCVKARKHKRKRHHRSAHHRPRGGASKQSKSDSSAQRAKPTHWSSNQKRRAAR